jgi:cell division protein FtsQ
MDSGGRVLFEIKRKTSVSEVRFDPAPSKVAYLANRIWLKKSSRRSFFIMILILIVLLVLIGLSNRSNLSLLIKKNTDKITQFVELIPIFKVVNLSVISEDPNVIEKISSILALNFPISSLDIDVEGLRLKVELIDLVESASVRLTSNGLVEVDVNIRKPVAIQRLGTRLMLIDARGVKVDEVLSRSQRLDLPLLAGKGAEKCVDEALHLLLEIKDLLSRVRGLVRVGERRWDIILNRGQVILLPEKNPLNAIRKIMSLQEGQKILDRNISYLDFRNINRPVLGLSEETSKELKEIRSLVRGENV